MPGIRSPLAGLEPGDIDMMIVRENTEGEYSSIGGRMFEGTEREVVVQETVMSRYRRRPRAEVRLRAGRVAAEKHLTSATKSNGIAITMPYWDERVDAMAPPLSRRAASTATTSTSWRRTSCSARRSSTWSSRATCSATSSATSGPPAPARSASRPRPTSIRRASTPRCSSRCTARRPTSPARGIANPIGQIWSGAMMLDFLGHRDAHDAIMRGHRDRARPGRAAVRGPATSAARPHRGPRAAPIADALGCDARRHIGRP